MKLVSWNVNGLRSCLTKGFLEYVKQEDPDIVCLQETKLQPEQAVFELEGYHRYFHSADKKGYSGTAVLTKEEPLSVVYGFGDDVHRHEGRVITAEYPEFYLVCCYTPNAQQELKRGHVGTFEALDLLVEECTADEQVISTLRPSTLEGCVVRVADMIAYVGKDRQDAMDMGALASLDEFDSTVMGKANAQIINNLTADIVNESYGRDRIAMSEAMFNDLKRAKRQNYEIIYNKEGLAASDGITVGEMFEEVYEKLLSDLTEGREESAIFRHHIDYLARKSRSITRESYVGATEPNQIVVDYIASMTDSYFMALYAHLFPEHATRVQLRGYCADLH